MAQQLTHDEIYSRVRKIIVDHLGVEEAKVSIDANFVNDIGLDSLDTVELVMAFEDDFGCEISDEVAEKITRVRDVVDLLYKEQGSGD